MPGGPIAASLRDHRRERSRHQKTRNGHLEALLNGDVDDRYFESCRRTVEQEATFGIGARFRSTAGNYPLRGAMDALARK
ncbi:MAG: hypothetical protein WB774_02350 [Xanthobacteraceae bacterium]